MFLFISVESEVPKVLDYLSNDVTFHHFWYYSFVVNEVLMFPMDWI